MNNFYAVIAAGVKAVLRKEGIKKAETAAAFIGNAFAKTIKDLNGRSYI